MDGWTVRRGTRSRREGDQPKLADSRFTIRPSPCQGSTTPTPAMTASTLAHACTFSTRTNTLRCLSRRWCLCRATDSVRAVGSGRINKACRTSLATSGRTENRFVIHDSHSVWSERRYRRLMRRRRCPCKHQPSQPVISHESARRLV